MPSYNISLPNTPLATLQSSLRPQTSVVFAAAVAALGALQEHRAALVRRPRLQGHAIHLVVHAVGALLVDQHPLVLALDLLLLRLRGVILQQPLLVLLDRDAGHHRLPDHVLQGVAGLALLAHDLREGALEVQQLPTLPAEIGRGLHLHQQLQVIKAGVSSEESGGLFGAAGLLLVELAVEHTLVPDLVRQLLRNAVVARRGDGLDQLCSQALVGDVKEVAVLLEDALLLVLRDGVAEVDGVACQVEHVEGLLRLQEALDHLLELGLLLPDELAELGVLDDTLVDGAGDVHEGPRVPLRLLPLLLFDQVLQGLADPALLEHGSEKILTPRLEDLPEDALDLDVEEVVPLVLHHQVQQRWEVDMDVGQRLNQGQTVGEARTQTLQQPQLFGPKLGRGRLESGLDRVEGVGRDLFVRLHEDGLDEVGGVIDVGAEMLDDHEHQVFLVAELLLADDHLEQLQQCLAESAHLLVLGAPQLVHDLGQDVGHLRQILLLLFVLVVYADDLGHQLLPLLEVEGQGGLVLHHDHLDQELTHRLRGHEVQHLWQLPALHQGLLHADGLVEVEGREDLHHVAREGVVGL